MKTKHLTPAQLADLLTKAAGEPVTEMMILIDIAEGAPVNEDGTLDLITYTAWLASEVK